jgi:hypothetical protein
MLVVKRTLAVMAVLGFALGAMAAGRSNGVRIIHLTEPTMVLGQKVEPGAYRLSWSQERGSDAVALSLKSENQSKVFASGKGVWSDSKQPHDYDGIVYDHGADGGDELSQIRFAGSVHTILVDTTAMSAEARRAKESGTN